MIPPAPVRPFFGRGDEREGQSVTDVYERLAKKLDELPNGYPATESGVEIAILRKIFSPEEAEFALRLGPMPETAEQVAERLKEPVESVRSMLALMAAKGEIGCFTRSGRRLYCLMPFVIGIYEFQVDRIDEELARLFREYEPALLGTLGGHPPAYTRVVPINRSIEGDLEVLRHEDMRRMIEEARSFVLRECICRKQRSLEGEPCTHTSETCLGFSMEEGAFESFTYSGTIIAREKAIEVMDTAEREGLVHCTYNVQDGQAFVCNCCRCCCPLLRGIRESRAPYLLARSNFVATIDGTRCSACGVCAEERCPVDAVVLEGAVHTAKLERCIGCGVCAIACPTGAISLARRPEAERDEPPRTLMRWGLARAACRNAHPAPPPPPPAGPESPASG